MLNFPAEELVDPDDSDNSQYVVAPNYSREDLLAELSRENMKKPQAGVSVIGDGLKASKKSISRGPGRPPKENPYKTSRLAQHVDIPEYKLSALEKTIKSDLHAMTVDQAVLWISDLTNRNIETKNRVEALTQELERETKARVDAELARDNYIQQANAYIQHLSKPTKESSSRSVGMQMRTLQHTSIGVDMIHSQSNTPANMNTSMSQAMRHQMTQGIPVNAARGTSIQTHPQASVPSGPLSSLYRNDQIEHT